MKIKIIRGIYGHRENGRVVEKTSAHAPFEVDENEGERLMKLGVAKKAGVSAKPDTQAEGPAEDHNDEGAKEQGTGHLSRESLETMKIGELRKLAEDMGLEKSGSRDDLIDRIAEAEFFVEEEDDDFPEISPAEPE